MSFGTQGAGQIPYWGVMLFNRMASVDAVEVPYRLGTDTIIDLISGRLDYTITPLSLALTNKDKLSVLAVTTKERSATLPDVPTMAEAALPGYEMPALRSIMGPAGMRRDIVDTLGRAIAESLASADVRQGLLNIGSVPVSSTPEQLRMRFEDWSAIFGKIAKDIGLKPQ